MAKKTINTKQCISTIFVSIILALVLFVPFSLSGNFEFAYTHLPFIGNDSISSLQTPLLANAFNAAGLPTLFAKIHLNYDLVFNFITKYSVMLYVGTLAFDIAFSIIVFFIKIDILRLIVRIVSIILGVALTVLTVVFAACFIGYFMSFNIDTIKTEIFASGAVFFFAMTIFSRILAKRQFGIFTAKIVKD